MQLIKLFVLTIGKRRRADFVELRHLLEIRLIAKIVFFLVLIQSCTDNQQVYVNELEGQIRVLKDSIDHLNQGSHFEKMRPSIFLDCTDNDYFEYTPVLVADGFYHNNSIFLIALACSECGINSIP